MTDTVLASLRRHVHFLDASLGIAAPPRLKPLSPAFARWRRQLARAGTCPDLDALAAALNAGDVLRSAIEDAHRAQPLAGVVAVRKAFAGIEGLLSDVSMAAAAQEPLPDAVLDLPTEGVLANLFQRAAHATARSTRPASRVARQASKPAAMSGRRRPTRAPGYSRRKAA